MLASRAEWRHETAYGGYQAHQQEAFSQKRFILVPRWRGKSSHRFNPALLGQLLWIFAKNTIKQALFVHFPIQSSSVVVIIFFLFSNNYRLAYNSQTSQSGAMWSLSGLRLPQGNATTLDF